MTDHIVNHAIPKNTSRTIPLPSDPTSRRADRHSVYIIVSSLLIVLGFKLLLINEFNPITPFWDQWDAEGSSLYVPIIEGHFDPAVLVSPWNEHRILFTRIINLAIFYAAGLWYPALQMVVNSFIHCATIFVTVYLLTRNIDFYARSILLLVLPLIYVIPFDVGNTLVGFQSQFYLLVLFSVLSVNMMSKSRAFSGIWLRGLMLSVASYFSMAPGALTAVAAGVTMALQIVAGSRQRTIREFVGIAVCVAFAVIELLNIPYIPSYASYKANSLSAFAMAVIEQASYPFKIPFGLLQYIPSVILVARVFTRKPRLGAYEWSALAIVTWIGSQVMAISYGRAGLGVLESRYTDIQILSLSANLGVAFHLLQNFWAKYFSTRLDNATLLARWLLLLCLVIVTLGAWVVPIGRTEFAAARAFGEHLLRETENTKAFLRTGDSSVFQGKPTLDVPYLPQRVAVLASEPTIRSILHPALTGRRLRHDLLLPLWLSKAIRDALLLLMRSGHIFIGMGIGMWLGLWSHQALREHKSKEGSF